MFKDDGPIVPGGQLLTKEVVQDMTAWCSEKGLISARAAEGFVPRLFDPNARDDRNLGVQMQLQALVGP